MEKNFIIDTELSSGHLEEALDFLRDFYLLPQPDSFKNISKRMLGGTGVLSYTVVSSEEEWEVRVEIQAANPFPVKIVTVSIPLEFDIAPKIDLLEEELFIAIQAFEDAIRQATLYFAWVEGEEIIPEAPPTRRKKASFRMFGSNMIMIYILFFGVNILLFLLLGIFLAIIGILVFQLVIVLLSDQLLLRTSDWKITPENPQVHIMEYQLPLEEFQKFQEKFGKDSIIKMKEEIYQKSLAVGREPTCELGEDIFREYGFHCQSDLKVSRETFKSDWQWKPYSLNISSPNSQVGSLPTARLFW